MSTGGDLEHLVVTLDGDSRGYQQVFDEAVAKAEASVDRILDSTVEATQQQQVLLAEAAYVIQSLTTPLELYEQGVARLDTLLEAGHLTQRQYNEALARAAQALPEVQAEQAAYNAELAMAKRIVDGTRTAGERYAERIAELDNLLRKGRIDQETYNRAVGALRQTLPGVIAEQKREADAIKEIAEANRKAARESAAAEQALMDKGNALTERLRTNQEKHRDGLNELNELYHRNAIGIETYNRGLADLDKQYGTLQPRIQMIASALHTAEGKFKSFGQSASLYITAPIVGAGVASFKEFVDFNSEITKATAIMDEVTEEQRLRMEKAAKDLALKGIQAPDKLAQAFYFLASSGLDAERSIGALPVVNKFATAGMFDLGKATEQLADTQSALGLESDNTAEHLSNMTKIANVLVDAANASNASVEQFSTSLTRKAAVAARNLKMPLEEVTAILATYAKQGIKSELASERTEIVLRELQNAASNNKETWDALGLSVYDANNNFRGIVPIVRDLENRMLGMSDAEKFATFEMLGFRTESKGALLSLLGMSEVTEGFIERFKDVEGVMDRVNNEQLKSMDSRLKNLTNQFRVTGIEIGETLVPYVEMAGAKVRELIGWWEGLEQAQKDQVVQNAALLAAIGPVSIAIGSLAGTLSSLVTVGGAVVGALGGVGAAVAGVTVAIGVGAVYAALEAKEAYTGYKESVEALSKANRELYETQRLVNSKILEGITDLPKGEQKGELEDELRKVNIAIEDYQQRIENAKKMKENAGGWFRFDDDWEQSERDMAEFGKRLEIAQEQANALQRAIKEAEKVSKEKQRVDQAAADAQDNFLNKDKLEQAKKVIESTMTPLEKYNAKVAALTKLRDMEGGISEEVFTKAVAKAREEMEKSEAKTTKLTDSLEKQLATFGMTRDEITLYELKLKGATDAELEHAEAVQKQIRELDERKKRLEWIEKLLQKGMTPLEKFNADMAKLDKMLADEEIGPDKYKAAVEALRKELNKDIKVKVDTKGIDAVAAGSAEAILRWQEHQATMMEVADIENELFAERKRKKEESDKHNAEALADWEVGNKWDKVRIAMAGGDIWGGEKQVAAASDAANRPMTDQEKEIAEALKAIVENTEPNLRPQVVIGVADL